MSLVSAIIVISLGIWGTIWLHLAKALERHGIEVFDQVRAKLKKEEMVADEGKVKKPVIYFIGIILNSTEGLILLLANLFGEPPALYTNMFGIGLVFLLLYSMKVLKEKITRQELYGAIIIIAGTIVLGVEGIFRPDYDEGTISILNSYVFIFSFLLLACIFVAIALKVGKVPLIGFTFGLFAGGFGGMDIVFKLLGQAAGGKTNYLPTTVFGWFVFLTSFAISWAAFSLTQWGFARKAPASVLVPAYDSMFVLLPVTFQVFLLPGYVILPSTIVGIVFIIFGIFLMKYKKASR
ncbi:MAG: hypothetical protein ACTSU9_13515 [Promethearchaeota archaeon]